MPSAHPIVYGIVVVCALVIYGLQRRRRRLIERNRNAMGRDLERR